MTRQNQKQREELFVKEAAKILGASWIFQENIESPDFIISENRHCFGLEVTEIFAGMTDAKKGSSQKSTESESQKKIDRIRREYENASSQTPLEVKILGDLSNNNIDNIINKIPDILIAKGIANRQIGHREIFEIASDTQFGLAPELKIFATKAIRSNWYSVSDRVGFVNRYPLDHIKQAICTKSNKLQQYMEKAGSDIRLLIYSDRQMNSGKLMLPDGAYCLDTQGFNIVYFFSFPESVTIFKKDKLSQTFYSN